MAALAEQLSIPRRHAWPGRLAVWCAWLVTTTLGWLAGSLAVLAVLAWTTGLADTIVRSGAGSAILGAIMGLAIGVGEWLVLRREVAGATRWIVVSLATWAVAWAIGHAMADALLEDYWLLGLVPGGVLLAASVGVGQWLVLRRWARSASWWLPASLVGWSAAGTVSMYGGAGLLAVGLAPFVGPAAWLIAAAPGAFAGLITGAALVALPRRSPHPI
jgi:hypothetical protein